MQSTTKRETQTSLLAKNMTAGALGACIAEVMTIPIDAAKVRLQLQRTPPGMTPKYTGMLSTITKISAEEGIKTLYRGVTPGLQRQIVNCSVRFGMYEHVRDTITPNLKPGENPALHMKILAAFLTGCSSICLANPMDVVKVRTQSLAREAGPGGEIPRTRAIYGSIYQNEGMKGFYRGIEANITRNALVNVGEMASYDQIKQLLLTYTKIPDTTPLHFISGFMAGFVATLIASPADVLKTRLMSNPDAYSSFLNCFTRIFKEEGIRAFYKGFVPNFTRLGTWSVICFMMMEKIKVFLIHPDDRKRPAH